MLALNMINLYVNDPAKSAAFYARLFGLEPVMSSPAFIMFTLPGGLGLGLWSRHSVEPTAAGAGGGSELAFAVQDTDGIYKEWVELGRTIAQPPSNADFGRNFVALDPDGHRLRVFTPVRA